MANGVYNRGKFLIGSGAVVWGTTDVRALLTTSSYSPNADHNTVSQITNELDGGNYVRKTLTTSAPSENDADDRVEYDADDVTWTALQAAAGTPQYLVVYRHDAGGDGASELLFWIDLGVSPPVPNGGDITLQVAAAGLLTLT